MKVTFEIDKGTPAYKVNRAIDSMIDELLDSNARQRLVIEVEKITEGRGNPGPTPSRRVRPKRAATPTRSPGRPRKTPAKSGRSGPMPAGTRRGPGRPRKTP